ncbi:hypothetical protein RUM43_002661 [Polyplax serrata]|uniref:Ig-like domain-containing protein n=1 Tax=Polyplax serrata TaxID=468196 RepID=A0AAN8NV30_POLSC
MNLRLGKDAYEIFKNFLLGKKTIDVRDTSNYYKISIPRPENCNSPSVVFLRVARSHSMPVPRIKGNRQLVGERYNAGENNNTVYLNIRGLTRDDEGEYTVTAKNLAGESQSAVQLRINDNSEDDETPIFLRKLNDLSVKVGTRTRFLVEIRSSSDLKVVWYRNDIPISEEEKFHFVHEGNFYCVDVAPVTVEDGGRWACVAENLAGRSSCSCRLNVLIPKTYKAPEFLEELQAILTNQGTVSLECKVVGVPTPVLRWYKDGKEIKPGDMFALTANPDDPTSLGTYTCEAVNCMGKSYSSSRVHVKGSTSREGSLKPNDSPPPHFVKELKNEMVKIGSGLTLSCKVAVPPWPRSIQWYNKEGKVEPSEKYHVMEDGLGGYSIEIFPLEAADEGEWKCVAKSDAGAMGVTHCTVQMSYPKNYRKPKFLESLKAILTDEGLVSFECKVVGFPTPQLQWFKDGQELKPGDVYQLTGTNSLGSYSCIAKNCMGEARSTAELTVEDIQYQLNDEEKLLLFSKNQPPRFIQGLKSCEAKINEDFRYTIKVTVVPEPKLCWYKDDEKIELVARFSVTKENLGVYHLDIKKLEITDQAEWKCVATNEFGQSVTSGFLKLIIPKHYKKPRFLECLRAILTEHGTLNLECKVIGIPQPTLKWYKDGKELKPGDIHKIISGQDGTCCLGVYTCEAHNCMGSVSSSASLLGFEDRMAVKESAIYKPDLQYNLAKNTSLSTINEERTSQMYDTPASEHSITTDERGDVSFSFDGKEVSISLYETPDLTEDEALQVVEMYADELSEHVSEQNVVELPPLRFTKESSKSGPLLMEAVVIDITPEYFSSAEEDLRTEADLEDVSMAEEMSQSRSPLSADADGFGSKSNAENIEQLLENMYNYEPKPKKISKDTSSGSDKESYKSFSDKKDDSTMADMSAVEVSLASSKDIVQRSRQGSRKSIKTKEDTVKSKKSRSRSSSMEKKQQFGGTVGDNSVVIPSKQKSTSRSSSIESTKKLQCTTKTTGKEDQSSDVKNRSDSANEVHTEIDTNKEMSSEKDNTTPKPPARKKKLSTSASEKMEEETSGRGTSLTEDRKDSTKRENENANETGKKRTSGSSTSSISDDVVTKKTKASQSSPVENNTETSMTERHKESNEKMAKGRLILLRNISNCLQEVQQGLTSANHQIEAKCSQEMNQTDYKDFTNSIQSLENNFLNVQKKLQDDATIPSFEALQTIDRPLQDLKTGLKLLEEKKENTEIDDTLEIFKLIVNHLRNQIMDIKGLNESQPQASFGIIEDLTQPLDELLGSMDKVKIELARRSKKGKCQLPVELLRILVQPVQTLKVVVETLQESDKTKVPAAAIAEPLKNLNSTLTLIEQEATKEGEVQAVSKKILERLATPVKEINRIVGVSEVLKPEALEKVSNHVQTLHKQLANMVQEMLFTPSKSKSPVGIESLPALRNLSESTREIINNLDNTTGENLPQTIKQKRQIFQPIIEPLKGFQSTIEQFQQFTGDEEVYSEAITEHLRNLDSNFSNIEKSLRSIPEKTKLEINHENLIQTIKEIRKEISVILRFVEFGGESSVEVWTALLAPLQKLNMNISAKKSGQDIPLLSKNSCSLGKSLEIIRQTSEDQLSMDISSGQDTRMSLAVLRPLEKPLQDLEEGFGVLVKHILEKERLTDEEKPVVERQLHGLLEILSQSFEIFQEKWVGTESTKEPDSALQEANILLDLVTELHKGTNAIQFQMSEFENISVNAETIIQKNIYVNLRNLMASIDEVEHLIRKDSFEVVPQLRVLGVKLKDLQSNIEAAKTTAETPEHAILLNNMSKSVANLTNNLEKTRCKSTTPEKSILDQIVQKSVAAFKQELLDVVYETGSEITEQECNRRIVHKAEEVAIKLNEVNTNFNIQSVPLVTSTLDELNKQIASIKKEEPTKAAIDDMIQAIESNINVIKEKNVFDEEQREVMVEFFKQIETKLVEATASKQKVDVLIEPLKEVKQCFEAVSCDSEGKFAQPLTKQAQELQENISMITEELKQSERPIEYVIEPLKLLCSALMEELHHSENVSALNEPDVPKPDTVKELLHLIRSNICMVQCCPLQMSKTTILTSLESLQADISDAIQSPETSEVTLTVLENIVKPLRGIEQALQTVQNPTDSQVPENLSSILKEAQNGISLVQTELTEKLNKSEEVNSLCKLVQPLDQLQISLSEILENFGQLESVTSQTAKLAEVIELSNIDGVLVTKLEALPAEAKEEIVRPLQTINSNLVEILKKGKPEEETAILTENLAKSLKELDDSLEAVQEFSVASLSEENIAKLKLIPQYLESAKAISTSGESKIYEDLLGGIEQLQQGIVNITQLSETAHKMAPSNANKANVEIFNIAVNLIEHNVAIIEEKPVIWQEAKVALIEPLKAIESKLLEISVKDVGSKTETMVKNLNTVLCQLQDNIVNDIKSVQTVNVPLTEYESSLEEIKREVATLEAQTKNIIAEMTMPESSELQDLYELVEPLHKLQEGFDKIIHLQVVEEKDSMHPPPLEEIIHLTDDSVKIILTETKLSEEVKQEFVQSLLTLKQNAIEITEKEDAKGTPEKVLVNVVKPLQLLKTGMEMVEKPPAESTEQLPTTISNILKPVICEIEMQLATIQNQMVLEGHKENIDLQSPMHFMESIVQPLEHMKICLIQILESVKSFGDRPESCDPTYTEVKKAVTQLLSSVNIVPELNESLKRELVEPLEDLCNKAEVLRTTNISEETKATVTVGLINPLLALLNATETLSDTKTETVEPLEQLSAVIENGIAVVEHKISSDLSEQDLSDAQSTEILMKLIEPVKKLAHIPQDDMKEIVREINKCKKNVEEETTQKDSSEVQTLKNECEEKERVVAGPTVTESKTQETVKIKSHLPATESQTQLLKDIIKDLAATEKLDVQKVATYINQLRTNLRAIKNQEVINVASKLGLEKLLQETETNVRALKEIKPEKICVTALQDLVKSVVELGKVFTIAEASDSDFQQAAPTIQHCVENLKRCNVSLIKEDAEAKEKLTKHVNQAEIKTVPEENVSSLDSSEVLKSSIISELMHLVDTNILLIENKEAIQLPVKETLAAPLKGFLTKLEEITEGHTETQDNINRAVQNLIEPMKQISEEINKVEEAIEIKQLIQNALETPLTEVETEVTLFEAKIPSTVDCTPVIELIEPLKEYTAVSSNITSPEDFDKEIVKPLIHVIDQNMAAVGQVTVLKDELREAIKEPLADIKVNLEQTHEDNREASVILQTLVEPFTNLSEWLGKVETAQINSAGKVEIQEILVPVKHIQKEMETFQKVVSIEAAKSDEVQHSVVLQEMGKSVSKLQTALAEVIQTYEVCSEILEHQLENSKLEEVIHLVEQDTVLISEQEILENEMIQAIVEPLREIQSKLKECSGKENEVNFELLNEMVTPFEDLKHQLETLHDKVVEEKCLQSLVQPLAQFQGSVEVLQDKISQDQSKELGHLSPSLDQLQKAIVQILDEEKTGELKAQDTKKLVQLNEIVHLIDRNVALVEQVKVLEIGATITPQLKELQSTLSTAAENEKLNTQTVEILQNLIQPLKELEESLEVAETVPLAENKLPPQVATSLVELQREIANVEDQVTVVLQKERANELDEIPESLKKLRVCVGLVTMTPQVTETLMSFNVPEVGNLKEVIQVLEKDATLLEKTEGFEDVKALASPLTDLKVKLIEVATMKRPDEKSVNVLESLAKPLKELQKGLETIEEIEGEAADSLKTDQIFKILAKPLIEMERGIAEVHKETIFELREQKPTLEREKILKEFVEPLMSIQETLSHLHLQENLALENRVTENLSNLIEVTRNNFAALNETPILKEKLKDDLLKTVKKLEATFITLSDTKVTDESVINLLVQLKEPLNKITLELAKSENKNNSLIPSSSLKSIKEDIAYVENKLCDKVEKLDKKEGSSICLRTIDEQLKELGDDLSECIKVNETIEENKVKIGKVITLVNNVIDAVKNAQILEYDTINHLTDTFNELKLNLSKVEKDAIDTGAVSIVGNIENPLQELTDAFYVVKNKLNESQRHMKISEISAGNLSPLKKVYDNFEALERQTKLELNDQNKSEEEKKLLGPFSESLHQVQIIFQNILPLATEKSAIKEVIQVIDQTVNVVNTNELLKAAIKTEIIEPLQHLEKRLRDTDISKTTKQNEILLTENLAKPLNLIKSSLQTLVNEAKNNLSLKNSLNSLAIQLMTAQEGITILQKATSPTSTVLQDISNPLEELNEGITKILIAEKEINPESPELNHGPQEENDKIPLILNDSEKKEEEKGPQYEEVKEKTDESEDKLGKEAEKNKKQMDEERKEAEEKKKKEEEERLKKEAEEKKKKEEEDRLKKEAEEKKKKEEEDRLKKEAEEKKKKEEEERKEAEEKKKKEEEERLKKEAEEKKKKLEEEKLRKEAEEKKKKEEETEEEERLTKEAEEKKKKEEEERLKKEAEEKKKKEEEERLKKEAEEKKKKEEEERLRKEAEEKKKKEEEDRLKKEAEEKKKKEEEDRLKKEAEEKKKKEEEEKLRKERLRRKRGKKKRTEKEEEEEEKLKKEAEEKKKKEEEERLRKAEEKKKKEEEDRLKKEAEEKKKKEEEEKLKKEAEEKKKKEEEDRLKKEAEEKKKKRRGNRLRRKRRKKKRRLKKEAEEKKKKLEEEKLRKEAEEKKKKEEEDRLKKEAEEKKKKEEEDRLKKEAEEKKKKLEEERLKKEAEEKKKKLEEEKLRKRLREKEERRRGQVRREKKKKLEEEKLRKEAEEKKKKEEEDRLKKEAEEKKKKEEEEKLKKEAEEKKKKEEEDRLKKEAEEKKKKEEEERLKKEAEEKKKKEEEEKEVKEGAEEKKKKEEEDKEAEEKKKEERLKKEAEEKKKKEEEERLKKEAEEKKKKEEEDRLKKEAEEKKKKEEEEIKRKEAEEKKKKLEEEKLRKEAEEKKKKEEEDRLKKEAEEKKKKERFQKAAGEEKEKERDEKLNKREEHERLNKEKDKKKDTSKIRKVSVKKKTKGEGEMICNEATRSIKQENEEKIQKNGGDGNIEYKKEDLDVESREMKSNIVNSQNDDTQKRMKESLKNDSEKRELLSSRSRCQEKTEEKAENDREINSDVIVSATAIGRQYKEAEEFKSIEKSPRPVARSRGLERWSKLKDEISDLHIKDSKVKVATKDTQSTTEHTGTELKSTRKEMSATNSDRVEYGYGYKSTRIEPESFRNMTPALSSWQLNRPTKGSNYPDIPSRAALGRAKSSGRTTLINSQSLSYLDLSSQRPRYSLPFYSKPMEHTSGWYRRKFHGSIGSFEMRSVASSYADDFKSLSKTSLEKLSSPSLLSVHHSYEPAPFPPIFTRPIRESYRLSEDELRIECRVRSQPSSRITWLKNGVPIVPGSRYRMTEKIDGLCTLSVYNPQPDDSGEYSCKAENSVSSALYSHYVSFPGKQHSLDDVKCGLLPRSYDSPRFYSGLTDDKFPVGGTIALQVELKGTPRQVKWLRGTEELSFASSKIQSFEDSGVYTLLVSDASEKESGIYTCRAYGSNGHIDTSAHIRVVPEATARGGQPPKIISRQTNLLVATVEDDFVLTCRAKGDPKPKVIWLKGVKDITVTERTMVEHMDDYYRFTLKKVVPADAGTYWIVARNMYGSDRSFVTLQIRQRARSLTPGPFSSSRWNWRGNRRNSLQDIQDTYLYQSKGSHNFSDQTSEP